MQNLQILRPLGSIALCGALGLALLGAAAGDAANSADTQFTQQAMQTLLQSVSNADVAESGGDAHMKSLASTIQYDEIAIGNQLGTLASFYGINVSTNAPKASTDAAGYAATQTQELQSLIVLFQSEERNGGGEQLRAFANQEIPVLQKDLQALQQT